MPIPRARYHTASISYTSYQEPLILVPPTVPLHPLLGIPLKVAIKVHPPPGDAVRGAKANGCAAHYAADRETSAKRLTTTQRQQRVEARPGSSESSAARRVAGQVEVGGEEEGRGEDEEGEGWGTGVEGGD